MAGKINTHPLWTKLLVLRMAASSSQWAEATSCSFEAPETGCRLLSAAVTAKPSQEKQVGGLIPFENNGKRQPFLGETRACCEADGCWICSTPGAEEKTFA